MKKFFRKIKGFTLIEVIVVIAIGAILTAIGVSGWNDFIQNNQAKMLASQLTATFRLARTTAIQSGNDITVCPMQQNVQQCAQSALTWNTWAITKGPTEYLKYYTGATHEAIKIKSDTSTGGPITFNSSGFADTSLIFTIKPPGCTGNNGIELQILQTGIVKTNEISC